ncbi:terminase large subunit [Rhodovulum sp. DZ06]|uniref:terminase large subunit n=1 Tax=Rhodovulum sp. DZ06 TaxID=3425126 RepID=UPI003D35329D
MSEEAAALDLRHAEAAHGYARAVVAGEIPASRLVIAACRRHLRDLERAEAGWDFVFDPIRAQRACRFIEALPHIKGEKAKKRERIRLEPWQCFLVCSIFGWVDAEGLRRFRSAYLEVPRKNAKSTVAAGVGLYLTGWDDEPGAEIYSAATSAKQARMVFDTARAMVKREARLAARGLLARVHEILWPATESVFAPVASQTNTLDGLNPHGAIIDELHEHRSRDVLDVLSSGMGAREQPLLLMITTAGSDIHGVCYEQHEYVEKILQRVFEDERYFGLIYGVDPEDDHGDEATWAKANPNWGVSVNPEHMRAEWAKARRSRPKLGDFKRKHLNVWTSVGEGAIDLDGWRKGRREITRAAFAGRGGITGMDLAIRHDLCAVVTALEEEPGGEIAVFGDYHVTEAVANEPGNEAILAWCDAGRIRMHPGAEINLDRVAEDALAHVRLFGSAELAFDPMYAAQMIQQLEPKLEAEGCIAVEVRQTPMNMTEPFERLMARALDGKVIHDGDPVLAWMASNTVAEKRGEFWRPGRTREFNKIDGISALVTAMARIAAPEEDETPLSPWEDEEFRLT